jgi:hypothetical protein
MKKRWPAIMSAMSAGSLRRFGLTSGMAAGSAERSRTCPRERGFTTTVVIVSPWEFSTSVSASRSRYTMGTQKAWMVGGASGSVGLTKAPASTPAEVMGPEPKILNWSPLRIIRQPSPWRK